MIPVEKILEAIIEQAKQGSCKTCRWRDIYKEPETVSPGVVLTSDCAIQGNVNPIWFTDSSLNEKPYPWVCQEGDFGIKEGCLLLCLAYQPASAYPIPFNEDGAKKALVQHREFMSELAYGVKLYRAIQCHELPKVTAWLNEATESLPTSLPTAAKE